jgi:hypothetical protein
MLIEKKFVQFLSKFVLMNYVCSLLFQVSKKSKRRKNELEGRIVQAMRPPV